MKADVFVNLCVQDVKRSRDFFEKLGFEIKEEYSDDTGYCLSINERAYAMMLGLEKYMLFSKNTVVDSFKHTESIFSLDLKTPEKVDEILEKVKNRATEEIMIVKIKKTFSKKLFTLITSAKQSVFGQFIAFAG